MTENQKIHFFACSVTEDLWGATPNADGTPLPTPGGGKWLPLAGPEALGEARKGFVEREAFAAIEKWGCHWFTSAGTRNINWGSEIPPTMKEKTKV